MVTGQGKGRRSEMEPASLQRAVDAVRSAASMVGLAAADAIIVNDSNRLVVRLTPCDSIARATPTTRLAGHQMSPEREVDVVERLARAGSPVAVLDTRVGPRVVVADGFKITFWVHYEQGRSFPLAGAVYAEALRRLHAGLRDVEGALPNIMGRVAAVQNDVASRDLTPDLTDTHRAFLAGVLRDLKSSIAGLRAPEQLLHGEPHSANVLRTKHGPLFIDFENVAAGPVEYDLAWVPKEVADCYPAADQDLVDRCRGLVLAMVAAYRWRRDDQHPSGRKSGVVFLNVLRDGPPWPALDDVVW